MRTLVVLTLFSISSLFLRAEEVTIVAHMSGFTPQVDFALLRGAQIRAAEILQTSGVSLEWRRGKVASCQAGGAASEVVLPVEILPFAPESASPTALAATVIEPCGPIIRLYWDRLSRLRQTWQCIDRSVLAHVLAHEITHALQGPKDHDDSGLMKAMWTRADFLKMGAAGLPVAK